MRGWLVLVVLSGCDQLGMGGECGPTECAGVCAQGAVAAAASEGAISTFESGLIEPLLTDVRRGIVPWSDQSVGICKGSGRDCDEYLGATVTDLPPGEYMVRAELRVPNIGEKGTWKVRFDTECTTTKKSANGETTTTNTSSKDYDVQYTGEEHGSRLSPLFKIQSPNKNGAQSCTWKLQSLHPDKPAEWTGSWSVPQG
jgi:hypothetical protein